MNNSLNKQSSLTIKEVDSHYLKGSSVYEFLDFVDYDPESKMFLSRDGRSVGAVIDITPIGCEGRSDDVLGVYHEELFSALQVIPEISKSPWTLQFFATDEPGLGDLKERVDCYAGGDNSTKLQKTFNKMMKEHIDLVGDSRGLFVDPQTERPWSGRVRKLKLLIYKKEEFNLRDKTPLEDTVEVLNDLITAVIERFNSAKFKSKQVGMKEVYNWLLPFFNDTSAFEGGSFELLKKYPYPGDENMGYGSDLPKLLFLNPMVSDAETGTWRTGNSFTRAYPLNSYRKVPQIGQLSAERIYGESQYALLDKLPEGTMINFTIVFKPMSETKRHLLKIAGLSKNTDPEGAQAKKQAEDALESTAVGDNLYPTTLTLFIKGNSVKEVDKRGREAAGLLSVNGLHLFEVGQDLISLNTYAKSLPFGYDYSKEPLERKAKYLYLSQAAALIPVYGRSRGTGNANAVFFNRGGEDITFDILKDKTKNAFGGILGPPGSGKSALLTYLAQCWASGSKARLFILEKGKSFELLGKYFMDNGLSVHSISLAADSPFGLMPFSRAVEMHEFDEAKKENPALVAVRDLLGEMELLARMMITEGDEHEEKELRNHHKTLIRQAIKLAAKNVFNDIASGALKPGSSVRVCHVVDALNSLADNIDVEEEKPKLREMARSMEKYTSGVEGHLFNGDSGKIPESDVTIIDFGTLANEGYQGALSLSFMCVMQDVVSLGERDQAKNIDTVIIADEAHLFLKNGLLAAYLIKLIKMFRKYRCWPWLATQNLADWSEESTKILDMLEWFIAMEPSPNEIEQLAKHLSLSADKKKLLSQCQKSKGKFTEGCLFGVGNEPILFRNIPPSYSLALAMTEGAEKAQRKNIMDDRGITEIEAVGVVSDLITKGRRCHD